MGFSVGFVIGFVGVLILSHAAYSTTQYKGLLKITEDEFSGPPFNDGFFARQPGFHNLQPSWKSICSRNQHEIGTLRSLKQWKKVIKAMEDSPRTYLSRLLFLNQISTPKEKLINSTGLLSSY